MSGLLTLSVAEHGSIWAGSEAATPGGSVAEVCRVFLKLGLISFGAPMADLGYFRAKPVVRRRWLDDHACADLVCFGHGSACKCRIASPTVDRPTPGASNKSRSVGNLSSGFMPAHEPNLDGLLSMVAGRHIDECRELSLNPNGLGLRAGRCGTVRRVYVRCERISRGDGGRPGKCF